MLSRLIQLFFVCVLHTNSIHARQGWRQRSKTKVKDKGQRKLGIQRTIKICGCWKKEYNLTLKERICHFGSCDTKISLRRVSCIHSHLDYMVKAISCHLAEHLLVTIGKTGNELLYALGWDSYLMLIGSNIARKLYIWYRKYNLLFFDPLLHISVKILIKMCKVWHLR